MPTSPYKKPTTAKKAPPRRVVNANAKARTVPKAKPRVSAGSSAGRSRSRPTTVAKKKGYSRKAKAPRVNAPRSNIGNTTGSASRQGIQPPPNRATPNNPGTGINGIIDIGNFLKSLLDQ